VRDVKNCSELISLRISGLRLVKIYTSKTVNPKKISQLQAEFKGGSASSARRYPGYGFELGDAVSVPSRFNEPMQGIHKTIEKPLLDLTDTLASTAGRERLNAGSRQLLRGLIVFPDFVPTKNYPRSDYRQEKQGDFTLARSIENEWKRQRKPFNQLTVFGDSYSDFGSRSAAMYQQVLHKDALPAYSGSTFSNAQSNWQTVLRNALGIPYDRVTGAGITNSFVGGGPSPIPASSTNSSYAIGGALSGKNTLYDVLAGLNPPMFPQALLAPPYSVSGLGVQSQISHALNVDNRSLENDLVTLWCGGNDLLAAVNTGQKLEAILQDVLKNTRASLITLLRSGNARSVLVSSMAALEGVVDGVAYAMPFVNELPLEWKALLAGGAATQFRNAVSSMVDEVKAMFPYAALVDFNNEYEYNWIRFGDKLGDFADYGITDTTHSAQFNHAAYANEYLYLDDVHPTESAHNMIAKAIELTLKAEKSSLDSAMLSDTIVAQQSVVRGTSFNDAITGSSDGSKLIGLGGNDWLVGLNGDDFLNGGDGKDLLYGGGGVNTMTGGSDADVFGISSAGLDAGIQTITDFNGADGDRLLLSEAYAKTIGDFFFVPTQQDWQRVVSFQPTAHGGLLNVYFTDPSKLDGVIALNGLSNFNTAWLC